MQALIDGIQEGAGFALNEDSVDALSPPTLEELAEQYRCARVRLLSAQEEETWATAEFIAARAALHYALDVLWPDPNAG